MKHAAAVIALKYRLTDSELHLRSNWYFGSLNTEHKILVPSCFVSPLVYSARLFFCVASMGFMKCGCWSFDGVVGVDMLLFLAGM
jgi:hypothetical protein